MAIEREEQFTTSQLLHSTQSPLGHKALPQNHLIDSPSHTQTLPCTVTESYFTKYWFSVLKSISQHCILLYALPYPGTHKPPLTAWPSIRRSAHLGWLPGALCYTSSGYFSEPSSPHIPAGQFSCEAWEVGIALELFCTVPGAVPDQNIQVFFCSRCIQLCIYLLIRIFWNSWQIFHLSREKTYSWRFGDMLCIRIYACPYVYKYVCVCMPRSRGRWLMDRQFMRVTTHSSV